MSSFDKAYLALVIGGFLVFAGTLAFADWWSQR